jgi:hypothetical protein
MQDSRFQNVARYLCLRPQTVELSYEREALSRPSGYKRRRSGDLAATTSKVWADMDVLRSDWKLVMVRRRLEMVEGSLSRGFTFDAFVP